MKRGSAGILGFDSRQLYLSFLPLSLLHRSYRDNDGKVQVIGV